MPEPICPACGETEALQGRPVNGDIEITCRHCGAEWMRGNPRCKRCGRADSVSAPQRMTRNPRGTQLAVIGVRQTLLCVDCDDEVVAESLEDTPVPEGYVSRYLFGEPRKADLGEPRRAVPKPANTLPQASPNTAASSSSRSAARPTQPPPDPPQITDPTLRQATEEFLGDAGSSVDSVAMVLLGSKLGPSTRLSRLDTEATADELERWVAQTFTSRKDQRAAAVTTLQRAVRYWLDHGWLTRDLTDGL